MKNTEMLPEVAKKYDCTIVPTIVEIQKPKPLRVDLTKISLIEADQLFKDGFKFLKLKEKSDAEQKK